MLYEDKGCFRDAGYDNTKILQDYGIEDTMNLLGQNRWIGRRNLWVVILDPGFPDHSAFEVEIDRRIYFYHSLERELVESYHINGIQFVRTIGVFSADFQETFLMKCYYFNRY